MILIVFYVFLVSALQIGLSIMLRKECPHDEVHKSCAFLEEYTCWSRADRLERVMTPPKRLPHCRAGCYCKRGLVRAYPGGLCLVAAGCRDRRLQAVLKKLPTNFPHM